MTKQELLTKVQSKIGFHSIIVDKLAPDNIQNDPIEKRYLYINHVNADGTMGKTYVYYLLDTANDVASFYNVETEALDIKETSTEQKRVNKLEDYLKANFDAFFLLGGRVDVPNFWAEAEGFKLTSGKLVRTKVLVFKKGANPVSHLEII